jgi:hypothetical protein
MELIEFTNTLTDAATRNFQSTRNFVCLCSLYTNASIWRVSLVSKRVLFRDERQILVHETHRVVSIFLTTTGYNQQDKGIDILAFIHPYTYIARVVFLTHTHTHTHANTNIPLNNQ